VSTPAPKNRNWLIVQSRKWHTWLGLAASLVVVTISATGFYLNHPDLFHGREAPPRQGATGRLRTTTPLAEVPVSFAFALAAARRHWGDVPIEHVQLKDERGRLIYKVKASEGRDLEVDARSGNVTLKTGYKSDRHTAAGVASGYDWPRVLKDVHTGRILGGPGRLAADLASVFLIVLTGTGLYLWGIAKVRKRAAERRTRSAMSPAVAAAPVRESALETAGVRSH